MGCRVFVSLSEGKISICSLTVSSSKEALPLWPPRRRGSGHSWWSSHRLQTCCVDGEAVRSGGVSNVWVELCLCGYHIQQRAFGRFHAQWSCTRVDFNLLVHTHTQRCYQTQLYFTSFIGYVVLTKSSCSACVILPVQQSCCCPCPSFPAEHPGTTLHLLEPLHTTLSSPHLPARRTAA